MPSRTRDTRHIYPLFLRRNGGADKNSQRKTESTMHNAWRILRKSSTAWLYMPGLRMVDYPPSTNSNRDFRGLSLLSSPKFFQSLTSRVLAARLARVQLYRRALGCCVDAGYADLRHNLPGERRYVRERLKEIGLGRCHQARRLFRRCFLFSTKPNLDPKKCKTVD